MVTPNYADINSLSKAGVYVVLLDITLANFGSLRITSNGEAVAFGGESFVPVPFQFGTMEKSMGGQNPTWTIEVENVQGAVLAQMLEYEAARKVAGSADNGMSVAVYGVNALDTSQVVMEEYFDLDRWSCPKPGKTVQFVFGGDNPIRIRFPRARFRSDFCDVKFGSARCGYVGPETSCNKTLARCRALGNSYRFAGWPGLGLGV